MKYAIIRDTLVENVVLWDGETEWQPPEGTTIVELGDTIAGPGFTYDGTTFTAPPEPEPETVEPFDATVEPDPPA